MKKLRKLTEQGLYDPSHEHDACGVGFVANIHGERSNEIIQQGLEVLRNLEHRGACGCDPLTGDGAGMLMHVPDAFLRAECEALEIELPAEGDYGVGMVFLPREVRERNACLEMFEKAIRESRQKLLGWRKVPIDPEQCGWLARESMPEIRQVFVGRGRETDEPEAFERKLYVIKNRVEQMTAESTLRDSESVHIASFSSRTITYKGLLISWQIPKFYRDLNDPRMVSGIAIVHQRFSTNTLPSWDRAHPYRMMAHNGEINTLRGNVNWMHARERNFRSPMFGDDVRKITPVINARGSDSAMFDNALELLVRAGRSIDHAVMMMIPEAWQNHPGMDTSRRDFYRYHQCLMEPWDGPASIAFTDGIRIGAVLDRNGLRPSRYVVTRDGLVVMASEVGVLDIAPERVFSKGRLQPGRMFLVDTSEGRIVSDEEIKDRMAARRPYGEWLEANMKRLETLEPGGDVPAPFDPEELLTQQQAFGYTSEELKVLIGPMAVNGQEAIGSMGTDTPPAVLSDKPQLLFSYFKQLFAQITNPAIDPIREEMVMSLLTTIGPERNLFDETEEHCRQLELKQPVLRDGDLARIKTSSFLPCETLSTLYDPSTGEKGLERALSVLCREAARTIRDGAEVLVLSDRGVTESIAAIPSLLAVAAVHHHLIRKGLRTRAALIVESGEPREVHHFALLAGYGAAAVNPYLAFQTIADMRGQNIIRDIELEDAIENYVKAIGKGMLKVMSKMGISTLQSYRGAQIFEAIGLHNDFVKQYFTWTASQIEGVGLEAIAHDVKKRHDYAFHVSPALDGELEPGGHYQYRRRGEYHSYNPETIALLQHSCRSGNYKTFRRYTEQVNRADENLATIRGLLKFRTGRPVPLDEVEPAGEIVKRFKTGAMSFGSISKEAHENLAIAMNRIGGKSNTGEGGEDPARFTPDENGDLRRSAIKQVASGRFGVTSWYLVNADEIQIKIAQGAKPGEGGQLPGHKVDSFIAKIRYSTPGVGLISPPPHHDIYSIEDIAQLIHDLKNANNQARISVKLVSEVGVGTIAAGVSKAKSDVVLISGYEGGTGASPLTSIKHAGTPWELGLAETQQVLVMNDLRGRIRVETDGQLKTGRDVAVAALLGAEEFGFATAALVASGCILMRVCHLNTCPVGVATQDPRLREKFEGKPEHVVNFMTFIAEELREIMAELGFRKVEDMVGRVEMLEADDAINHWKAFGIDLAPILHRPEVDPGIAIHAVEDQDHELEKALDNQIIEQARPALERGEPVEIEFPIRNINRTVGTMLSAEVSRRYGLAGLPDSTIRLRFRGSAGQSFCAFLAQGLDVRIEGDANDYFGKGMSAGRIVVVPPPEATFVAEENVIVGNVSLYGATGGEVYVRGIAGERFGIRNSGATAVVEGVGDHGCEYMTGGRVLCLGTAGRNFAAGMSGGVAWIFDEAGTFPSHCNTGMVELDPLEESDFATIWTLLEEHHELTGSAVAGRILQDWSELSQKFVKVMPVEYRKVLAAQHLDSDEAKLATV